MVQYLCVTAEATTKVNATITTSFFREVSFIIIRSGEMIELLIFAISFAVYSGFRYVDIVSTAYVLRHLDLELHEVNPLIVPLAKKTGFKKAMVSLWLLFAVPIGLGDAFIIYPTLGYPALSYMLGIFHLLAAANNVQIYFQVQIVGAENVRQNTLNQIRTLKRLSLWRKVIYLVKMNFFEIFMSAYGFFALVLLSQLLTTLVLSFSEPTSLSLLFVPSIMILDLIWFFPVSVLGSIIISRRRLRLIENMETLSGDPRRQMTIPVGILREAIDKADRSGADYVRIFLPEGE